MLFRYLFIFFFQELFRMAQKKGSQSSEYEAMADKLTDTINLELIEPLARVNRAYKFAKSVPKCTRYSFQLFILYKIGN